MVVRRHPDTHAELTGCVRSLHEMRVGVVVVGVGCVRDVQFKQQHSLFLSSN